MTCERASAPLLHLLAHKVIQAAGRVIRTRNDHGVVYLIDDRFTRREVRELLPKWWKVQLLPAPGGATASGLKFRHDDSAPSQQL